VYKTSGEATGEMERFKPPTCLQSHEWTYYDTAGIERLVVSWSKKQKFRF